MVDSLDIRQVVRRTGLTSRALRFYEAKGLIVPVRTSSGRRFYGPRELARLHQVTTLKRAGFTLAHIKQLLDGRQINLAQIFATQLDLLDEQASALNDARAVLRLALDRLDQGDQIDTATFCELIHRGEGLMKRGAADWRRVTDRYFTPDQRAEWEQALAQLPHDFSHDDYSARWQDLGNQIKTALPMDPAGSQAQRFVDRWFALLQPFATVATPEMWNGTMAMYDRMDEWQDDLDPGFDKTVWDFIKLATAARLATGGTIGGGPQRKDRR